jgi:HSP20 family protein
MLLRFDPFREFDRLAEQLAGQAAGANASPTVPMDALRTGDTVEIRFDLPGFDPASVDLEVDRNVLTLTAERPWAPAEGTQVIAHERRHGRISRQLMLGDTLDGGRIQADFRDGVLTVTIPVAEAAKPRKVAIGGGGSEPAAIDVSERSDERELSNAAS